MCSCQVLIGYCYPQNIESVSACTMCVGCWVFTPVHTTCDLKAFCGVSVVSVTRCVCLQDTLMELILNRDQLSDSGLQSVLTVLSGLNNVSTVDSLERAVSLVDRLSETVDKVNFKWTLNGQEVRTGILKLVCLK